MFGISPYMEDVRAALMPVYRPDYKMHVEGILKRKRHKRKRKPC